MGPQTSQTHLNSPDGLYATLSVSSIGVHTVNVWMREDGFRLDRVLLSTNSAFVPSGIGPAESQRNGGNAPATPTGLTAVSGAGRVDLDWNDTALATGYNVYRDTVSTVSTSGTPLNGATPLSTSAFNDTTPSPGVTYYYVVTAVNGAGASAPTAPVSGQSSSPVVCSDSTNPTILNFSGPVAATYAGTGFKCFMPGTIAPDAANTGLTLSGFNSQLKVASTDGDIRGTNTGQTNALSLRFANSGSYGVRTRIKGPFTTTSQFQAAGVFLALNSDNYARFALGQLGTTGRLEFTVETSATTTLAAPDTSFDLSEIDGSTEALDLWLVRRSDGKIEALYRKITNFTSTPVFGPIISAGVTANAPSWSVSSGTLHGGLLTTDNGPGASFTTTFDEFELGAAVIGSAAPPPISFNNKVIIKNGTNSGTAFGVGGFVNPSSLELGPDGKLYVASQAGQIYIVTLDQTKLGQTGQMPVTSVQTLLDIYNKPTRTCNIGGNLNNCQFQSGTPTGRQVTGLAVGPESTATNIVLYVSNSDPRIGTNNASTALAIDTHSGTITKLVLQPDAATSDPNDYKVTSNQDLVVGLPRSRENHSVNGMDFGPDGWMYIGIGGNTNYGKPSAYFSDLPEYYLSAAVVRLNVNNLSGTTLPLNMESVNSAAGMTPFAGKFELFATGYRNGFDLVWHSNGKLYLNDNGGNVGLGGTPGSNDGCGTPSIDPGSLADTLHLVTQNAYGGHPSPVRNQCVLNDGQNYSPPLTPQSNYVAPLLMYRTSASTDGIAEYKSNAFNGQMQGNLITATYAGNLNVRRVILNAAGTGVVDEVNLAPFNQPLDVATDANGVIYVAEHGGNQISVMVPNQTGATCPIPGSDPNVTDSDGDGYKDADETANTTDPCSAASKPTDFDNDSISDLNDPDDDNDGIADTQDQLFFDAQNGAATTLPLAFEWNPGDANLGKLALTGFTGTQIATSGVRTNTSAIRVGAAGGFMSVTTSGGTAEGAANSQVNALQLGFDSSSDFRIWSRIVGPFNSVTPSSGHVGGIFFGPDQNSFIRLALLGASGGNQVLQLGLEQNGVLIEQSSISLGTSPITNLDLYLIGNFNAKTITAYYVQAAGGTPIQLGAPVTVPATWFSNNLGAARNTSLAGVVTRLT